MKRTAPSVADLPVHIGIRLVAMQCLEDADKALQRLSGSRDAEALHDFRVALRRLRSCFRAYRPYIDDSVRNADRREIRGIARATGNARDVEVQLEWLRSQRRLSSKAAAGAKRLVHKLRERQKEAEAAAGDAIGDFPAVQHRLRESLSRYSALIDPTDPLRAPTTAEIAAGLATLYSASLSSTMASVRSVEDGLRAHQTRIAGKRLRYVLEPLEPDTARGKTAVASLRKLQDDLGDLHDLDVMLDLVGAAIEELDPVADAESRAELAALGDHVRLRRDRTFAAVNKAWLADGARALLDEVRAVAEALQTHTGPAVEIERKFLLRGMPRPKKATSVRIDQGWLPGKRLLERVRRVRSANGTRYYRTLKFGRGLTRREVEEETTEAVFRQLWPLTRGRRVAKRRVMVKDGPFTWEIDRFYGRDLVLAEVELPAPDTPVEPPAWLERRIVREVTGDPVYLNENLAS
ncbi:MAG: CHAD domain-containing protein [Gemmatimonadetes bacterium]|nr:CHAD domain-containing protein [Gemmatimonadota bacterium]